MNEGKILVVEDDTEISQLLQTIINQMNLHNITAYSGTEAMFQLEKQTFSLVLLDLMLPGLTGEEVLAKIRKKSDIPILILSAKNHIEDKVSLLKMGADDYVTKPFNQEEIAARIEVQLRKKSTKNATRLIWRDLILDKVKLTASLAEEELLLTNAEFDILNILMQHPEQAFSKKKIYESIWNGTYIGDDNTISVHISNLRNKMGKITNDEYIKTVWGIGFMLI